jgi:NAD dependent epimerase/dehydratase family enzyme
MMRSAITLSPDRGGAFDTLLALVRYGLGGPAGDGRQYISWVHDKDFIAAVRWLIDREDLDGVVNIASPYPVPNADFMRVLRRAWGMPVGLAAARWMIEIGAFFLRTESELLLKSRRVVPKRLLESGFVFRYSLWEDAASDLCREWKARRARPLSRLLAGRAA